jgi:hypothetical protein
MIDLFWENHEHSACDRHLCDIRSRVRNTNIMRTFENITTSIEAEL